MTQSWVAMCYYPLLTYIKCQTKYGFSLLQLSRVIRETFFERKALIDILTLKLDRRELPATEVRLQSGLPCFNDRAYR